MGFINAAHVIFFWAHIIPGNSDHMIRWSYLIIVIHSLMLFINGILGLLAFILKKREKQATKIAYFVQFISAFINLVFGVLLCISDQLVTTDINPLLTASIGVGVIFLIPPIVAAVLYSTIFFLFFNMITWTQNVPELLEHVRANSLAAIGMGFGVSWLLWMNNVVKIQQERLIKDQKRKLEETNENLWFLATHDSLTGLFNRSYFIELVEMEKDKVCGIKSEACIIVLDIDFFKKINDTFGHPAGDEILRETSRILVSTLRSVDVSARLGGEEFIVLLPETDLEAGEKVAEKLRKIIQEYSFSFHGRLIKVTASFGVARLTDSFHMCYTEADQALYVAKKRGRNCVEIAHNS
ncbi:GGDEF domain-containing protein [Aneurinibacillus uraniidurans]|uniref:GGDEF domain-containing protein n=1 Tax=Aneurinibacillus uraniidurans TaxID=2966586 RepID=UPI00234905AD|nr:GGDEF domain-containing protein [Aneurinibacillus sp. B1]WCN36385.1 GGDEF domain-containing protein [Aneurinibacillus sp. B1]